MTTVREGSDAQHKHPRPHDYDDLVDTHMGQRRTRPLGEQDKSSDRDHDPDDARQHRLDRSPEKDGHKNGPAEERVNRLRVKLRGTRPVLSVMIRVLGEMFFGQAL
jgi:hypothetical protein